MALPVPLPLLAACLVLASPGERDPEAWAREARPLREKGEEQAALDLILQGLGEHPDSPLLELEAGRSLERLDRRESASRRFERALELRPGWVPALVSLGVLRSEEGRLDEAATYLRAAVEIDARSLAAQHNLAIVLERQGKLDEALARYRTAAELDPKEARARFGAGSVLEKQGKIEEAARELEAAVGLDAGLEPALYRLAAISFRMGRKEDGERYTARFREAKARAHFARGEKLRQRKDVQGAVREYERAIDAKADFLEAHERLVAACFALADPAGAVDHARRCAEIDPKADRYASLAVALARAGRREEASRALDRAVELDRTRKDAFEALRRELTKGDGKPP